MTYEKFAKTMESKDNGLDRKSIHLFTVRYALVLFLCALALTTVIVNILGLIFCVLFLILSLFLYVWSFDIFVDNEVYFNKLTKIFKYWWGIVIFFVTLCILINLFII